MSPPIVKLIRKNNFRFAHIEGLRALAALSLMFCHISFYGSFFLEKSQYYTMLNHPVIKVIATSGIFLDIFFVISGFLISYILIKEFKEKCAVNLRGFFMRRFARIYPLYVFILIVAMPFSTKNAHNIIYNLLLVNNLIPMQDQYLNWCWTIAVEFQFYFLFGIIMALVSKNIIGKKICTLLAIGFILLPLIIMGKYIISHHYYYITNDVFLATNQEFKNFIGIGFDKIYLHTMPLTYGVLTAYVLVYHKATLQQWFDRLSPTATNAITLLLLGFLFLLFANNDIWFLNRTHDIWQTSTIWMMLCYHTFFYPPLCALLLISSSPKGIVINTIVKFLSAAIWRPFARLSYGTYLLHPILLLIGFSVFVGTHPTFSVADYFRFGLVLILITYLIAIPLYLFYEQPILLFLTQRFQAKRQDNAPLQPGRSEIGFSL